MKMRTVTALATASLLVAFGALAGGCKNGGGSPPVGTPTAAPTVGSTAEPTTASTAEPSAELENYFQQLDAAENTFREKNNAVGNQLSLLDDTTVDQAAGLVEQSVAAINEFLAALEGMNPPEEVAEAHAESVAGFRTVSALLEDSLPEIESAATMTELNAFFSTEEFTSVSDSLDGACAALEGIASANGVVVDLGCGN